MTISQSLLGIQRDEGNQEWPDLTKTEGRQSIAKTFHGCLYLVTKTLSTCQTQMWSLHPTQSLSPAWSWEIRARRFRQEDREAAQEEKTLILE